jgi:Fe-Mn family superoxide dismutase
VINGLKREELSALNSMLLHELYFASLGGDGKPKPALAAALARDFGSVDRWHSEFMAMAYALGGGSGWVTLVHVPRDGRLVNQFAAEPVAGGIPILALDMYEHAYHIDFGANPKAYVDAFMRNVDWQAVQDRYEDALKVAPPRPVVQKEFGDLPGIDVEEVKAMLDAGKPLKLIDACPKHFVSVRTSPSARPGATRNGWRNGWASCRRRSRWSCIASTASTSAAARRSPCAKPASTPGT